MAVIGAGVAATPASAIAVARYPVVSVGSYGVNVLALQLLLRHHGHTIDASGTFDGATADAVAIVQSAAALTPDGIVRPATWRALVPPLAEGVEVEAVAAVKQLLNAKRAAGLSVSGSFDAPTTGAVRQLQQRLGLPRTGVVDEPTWRHLLWLFVRPRLGDSLCGYEVYRGRSFKWGAAGAVAQLERAGQLYRERTGEPIAVGDISRELGGNISGHATHEVGLDVDIRPARKDHRECRWGVYHSTRSYDRNGTRSLINAIRDAAPGRIKLIYFNDPVLVREGLVRARRNHDAHLHIRFCEIDHPRVAYRCP
jgi:hypothetical protein